MSKQFKTEIFDRLYNYMQDEDTLNGKDDLEYLVSKYDDEEDFDERLKLLKAIDKELRFQGV